ncbi:MAG: peptidoglycan synthetase [Gammaproteobacteria bacterium]|nr:MAG: peptidoglycan synthetase [Gammaproteobacteria bacterium]
MSNKFNKPKKPTKKLNKFNIKVTKPLKRRGSNSSATTNKLTKQTQAKSKWLSKVLPLDEGKTASKKSANNNRNYKKQTYTSVKNRKTRPVFNKNSGAMTRGGVESDGGRFGVVWVTALAVFLILLMRAFYLQVANAEFYQKKGDELITSVRTQHAYRGMILDRNNQPLAVSAPLSNVSFSPYDYARSYYDLKKEIKNTTNTERLSKLNKRLENMDLARLATAANVDVNKLRQATKINNNLDVTNPDKVAAALPKGKGSHYFPLFNKVTPEIADGVMSLNFPAVYEKQNFRRFYPQSQPNAQLVGFMSQNENDPEGGYKGRSGIEMMYQEKLAGKDGKVLVLKDARQSSLKEIEQIEPEIQGEDVKLTIDSRLQYLLFKELEKVGRLQGALWSSGIVVDVQTGEVLALSTWPSYNANNLNEMTGESQRNRPLIDSFEPGSVMKPFTVAAALKSGKFGKHTVINTNPGYIRIGGYTIRDHNNLGSISLATLLKKSSNVASTKIALSLPADAISQMQQQFGFGKKTDLGFPGEAKGMVTIPKKREYARRATVSYGYGLQVTLAQLAQAYAALGSGGIMHPLTLVKPNKQAEGTQVLDKEDALAIVEMMETVTQAGGTATAAAIDGYRVAGKTGTSRRVKPKGGYYENQYRTVFVGMAPVSNPRLVAAILVENPQKQHYAGQVSAPVFHNVMKDALRLYNVPLDKPLKMQ